MAEILSDKLRVVNIGLEMFAQIMAEAGVPVTQIDWRPPGDGDAQLAWTLARLVGDREDADAPGSVVDRANEAAVKRMLEAQPVLVDVALRADEIWPRSGPAGARRSPMPARPSPGRTCATR